MIHFTFRGHKISIRNDDWRKLKERFNAENAERDAYGDYAIKIPCPLCLRYENCVGCPLENINNNGCATILYSIFGRRKFNAGDRDRIWWFGDDNAQARRQLKAILRRMEKIEQSQEG